MFPKCLRLLRSFPKILPTPLAGQKQEIDRIKAGADAALTEFCNDTTQMCLRRMKAAKP